VVYDALLLCCAVCVDELQLLRLSCSLSTGPVWAQEHCRISPPHFLAECRRRLNQTSFVFLPCFALFAFSGFCLVFVVCLF